MRSATGVLFAAAIAASLTALPAVAKEIEGLSVCGAAGCDAIDVNPRNHALIEGGRISDAPKNPAPFYRLRLAVGDGSGKIVERFKLLYVPSAPRLRGIDGTWMKPMPRTDRALVRAVRGHEPFPASELQQATRERVGTSLPPEVFPPPQDAEEKDERRSGWLIALGAGGGLALLSGCAAAIRRRARRSP